jgi:hypothetical protein
MNVWSGGREWYRAAERGKGYSVTAQEVDQGLAFNSIRIEIHVHGVVMIEPPAIVNRSLPEDSDRQRAAKFLSKETLQLPRV